MRIRFPRRRLNPVPGTKSTQSRYFLGYFVFVDEPDVGYAVAVRGAAPQGKLRRQMDLPPDIIKQVALLSATAAAQKLSDKLDRSVAFMPILPQATKYEAVEHLYGGAGSRKYGGPRAKGSVSLSRTRLPNREVSQTALASVQAHWESLYGPGRLGQTGWPRGNAEFRTPEAYEVTDKSFRFSPDAMPYVPGRKAAEATKKQLAKKKRQLEKARRTAAGTSGPEQATAQRIVTRREQQVGVLDAMVAELLGPTVIDLSEILDQADLPDTPTVRTWAKSLILFFPDKGAVNTDSLSTVVSALAALVIEGLPDAKRLNRFGFATIDGYRQLLFDEYVGVEEVLAEYGIPKGQFEDLARITIQMVIQAGILPAMNFRGVDVA